MNLDKYRVFTDSEIKQIRRIINSETDLEKAKDNFDMVLMFSNWVVDTTLLAKEIMEKLEAEEKKPKQISMRLVTMKE